MATDKKKGKEVARGIIIREQAVHGRIRHIVAISAERAGKRLRKAFSEPEAAEDWASHKDMQLAARGHSVLEEVGGYTVAEAIKKFTEIKQMERLHAQECRHVLNLFKNRHGGAPVKLINALDLTSFLSSGRDKPKKKPWSPTTQAKGFRYLRMFFNWCERYDLIDRNPARRMEPPKASDPPKEILSPEEMREYLKNPDPVLHAFLCCGGFAGVRTSEFWNLLPEHFEPTQILVNAGTTEERYVTRLPAFDANWIAMPAMAWKSHNSFYEHIKRVLGHALPKNALRHSFGSYHVAMWEDFGKAAKQLGNGEYVTRRSYARNRNKAAAVAWWGINVPLKILPKAEAA